MKQGYVFLTSLIMFLTLVVSPAVAITDPLAVANNKIGIHILQPEEIEAAAKLVNNDGQSSWGYVTVPIQASDRDRVKWGKFMKRAVELKMIPIIRVATVPEGNSWVRPNDFDLIDFANFLNELDWPVRNRYVVIFNEVNHSLEYGGMLAPEHYALILKNAVEIFKERNADFFMLPAALDNATVSNGSSLHWREYLRRMNAAVPGIFGLVDGWNSHAYPNPAFAGRVSDVTDRSVRSYLFDLQFLARLGVSLKYVFITETGWDIQKVGEERAAVLLTEAYREIWSEARVVAVTPFLLHAGQGPFVKFSFLKGAQEPTAVYLRWQSLAMTPGEPALSELETVAGVAVTVPEVKEADVAWWKFDGPSWVRVLGILGRWFKMGAWN